MSWRRDGMFLAQQSAPGAQVHADVEEELAAEPLAARAAGGVAKCLKVSVASDACRRGHGRHAKNTPIAFVNSQHVATPCSEARRIRS